MENHIKIPFRFNLKFAATLIAAFGGLFVAGVAQAAPISKTAMAGAYSVTLKVLPAESFTGPKADMVREGGAAPVTLNGPDHPNHHLVAFVKKDGAPVEDASVAIEYSKVNPKTGSWKDLPVTRMYIAGQGVKSTHYGNNVDLGAGSYEARVTVDGKYTANYRFTLSGGSKG